MMEMSEICLIGVFISAIISELQVKMCNRIQKLKREKPLYLSLRFMESNFGTKVEYILIT